MTYGINNMYNNPYQQQLNQLQQRLQAMQPQQQVQQQVPIAENKVIMVSNEEAARNTQIPLDGTTTYFVFDQTILARRWDINNGCVANLIYKLQEEVKPPIQEVVDNDRLAGIEDTLQEILKKVTYPINKKVAEKGDKDVK